MKIVSPDILHKTEAGGVIVGVKSAEEASQAYDTILANAKKYKADANIVGVQVQQMLKGGQEVIVGADHRRQLRQAGRLRPGRRAGRSAEGHHLPPGARHHAKTRCRCWTASRPPKCSRACAAATRSTAKRCATSSCGVSQLVSDFPEISEMDLNPVFATKDGAIAADVRIVVDFDAEAAALPPGREGRGHVDEPHHAAQVGGGDRRIRPKPARSATR